MRGHPARAIARKHKAAVEAWLADGLNAAEVAFARDRARESLLLMEGAMASMLIHGNRDFANAAARAAKTLVRRS